jgi:hypothetical protein
MTQITVPIPDEQLQELHEKANRLGVSIELLARIGIESILVDLAEDFEKASGYVLKKNAELYKRLA